MVILKSSAFHLIVLSQLLCVKYITSNVVDIQIPPAISQYLEEDDDGEEFTYDGKKGPDHWKEKYKTCVGKHQSPINIDNHHVIRKQFPPLHFENVTHEVKGAILENNGHTVMMTINDTDVPSVSGGPLRGEYDFSQMHFHWGDNDTFGSETLFENHSFPMEVHMVFYKASYGTQSEAQTHPDGLTVLAFLFEVDDEDNKNYADLVSALKNVREAGQKTLIPHFNNVKSMVSENINEYYTYDGSLTTPPCSEVVQWVEFVPRIKLSHDQLDAFRHLYSHSGVMKHNFRPVQPIYNRTVFYNNQTEASHPKGLSHPYKDNSGQYHTVSTFVMVLCVVVARLSL